jgi:hypothetical protein
MPTDEIPDDIAALLRVAKAADVPPAGAKERIWAQTMARVDAPGAGPGPGSRGASTLPGKAALSGFAAGLLSGIVGTVVVMTFLAAPAEVVDLPAPVETRVTEVASAPAEKPASTPAPAKTLPRVQPTPSPAPVEKERATERAWLDAARTALSRGDFEAAAQALETARARFPEGSLDEEREALGVHVLLARGDAAAARLAADAFRKRHGQSLFLPAIEAAMREMESQR